MGYMGFGMRKEDYTRRPKKSFNKIKKIYGEDLNLPKVKGKTDEYISIENLESRRFKQFYQTRTFKIISITFFISIIGYLAWDLWIFEILKDRQINKFERTGIIKYYNDNKSDFLLIKEYITEKSDRVSEIKFDSKTKAYSISIRDKKLTNTVPKNEIFRYYYDGKLFPGISNDKIDNGMLVLKNNSIDQNWAYTFINVKLEQIDKSFIDYIDNSSTNLNKIVTLIKDKEIGIIHTNDKTLISFNHSSYGQYNIVFTDKVLKDTKLKLGDTDIETKVGQIDNGIYWTKTKFVTGPSR
jgi:hypothetical protein